MFFKIGVLKTFAIFAGNFKEQPFLLSSSGDCFGTTYQTLEAKHLQ